MREWAGFQMSPSRYTVQLNCVVTHCWPRQYLVAVLKLYDGAILRDLGGGTSHGVHD
jgi:hypothetical protein